MSHLSLPRIHFQGDFCTNVATVNNNDVVKVIDVAKVTVDTLIDVAPATVDTQGKSYDESFRAWLKELDPEQGRIRAGWNYYGDNNCKFQDVKVTCIELPDRMITADADDPLIGADVLLDPAVMVDLDPSGGLGTQIFCHQFAVQKGNDLALEGPPTRLYSRWLTSQRNLGLVGFEAASAVWQAAIPGDQSPFVMANSPALEALHAASEAPNGFMMRFCTYLVAPRIDEADLAQRFANGEEVENPAYGRVLGTIGPWQAEEPTSVTLGRLLHPFDAATGDHTQFRLAGPAVAQADRDRRVVSLDLITAFPERDAELNKASLGPVSLRLRSQDNQSNEMVNIGPVAYDKTAYETTAGTVDVPYSPDVEPFLDNGQLLLVQDDSGKELLAETDLMVETDDRAIYLQKGETQQVHLRVVEKGEGPQK